MTKEKIKEIRNVVSSKSDIYMSWKWWDIHDDLLRRVDSEDYGKNVGDVAIVQKMNIKQSKKLLEDDKLEPTGEFYITCESSRWSRLYRKYIPKKILPLFEDLIDKANAEGFYRTYKYNDFVF